MPKKGPRTGINLECAECGKYNYLTEKNRLKTQEKLKMKKYCPRCRKHTLHNEQKVK